MSTGTVQNPSKTLFKHTDGGAIKKTFTAGEDLVAGDNVAISGDGEVSKAGATDLGIGVVIVGDTSGNDVTVLVSAYVADCLCVATGGALAAGSLVAYNGANTDGVPQVVAAGSGDVAKGIILVGGAADTEIRIGLIEGFYKLP
mgnify:CR=1 FL=1